MTICDSDILLSYLDTTLQGPQTVCAEQSNTYTVAAFRQSYKDRQVPIAFYVWALNNWEPFAVIQVNDADSLTQNVYFPSEGPYILNVSAVDIEGNVDLAQLNINSYLCDNLPIIQFNADKKYCANVPVSFTATREQKCIETTCTSAIRYAWYVGTGIYQEEGAIIGLENQSLISATNVSNIDTNTISYTFPSADLYTISVHVTSQLYDACVLKFLESSYRTNICVTDCSLGTLSSTIEAKNLTTQISACTGETIAFTVTARLNCNPFCIPISAYKWQIDGGIRNSYTYNLYDIQTYAYPSSSSGLADIVSVTAYDISGNTSVSLLSVDVDNTIYCPNKNKLELQLAGQPFICISPSSTNTITYSAYATPYYTSNTPTPISAYKWVAYDSFNDLITSNTIITSFINQ